MLIGDRLVVIAQTAMQGWEPSRYRPALIRFEGRTWRVTGKIAGEATSVRYELTAWQPTDGEITGPTIEYTPGYVGLRDRALALGHRRGYIVLLLRALSPLVGLLPARTKGHFEEVYGLDPVASTFQSVFLEFLVTLGGFVMALIGTMVLAHSGETGGISRALFAAIGLIAGADGAVRYGRILKEERPPVGFYEWIWRRTP